MDIILESNFATTDKDIEEKKALLMRSLNAQALVAPPGQLVSTFGEVLVRAPYGSYVRAERGATVLAEDGAIVQAQRGSSVLANGKCVIFSFENAHIIKTSDKALILDSKSIKDRAYAIIFIEDTKPKYIGDHAVAVAKPGANVLAGMNCHLVAFKGANIRIGPYSTVLADDDATIECGSSCRIVAGHNSRITTGNRCKVRCGDGCIVKIGSECNVSAGADLNRGLVER